MQALSDEQQMERLEKKVDDGFADLRQQISSSEHALRSEIIAVGGNARDDFRTLIAVNLTMVLAMIFGFAGIIVAMLAHG